MKIAIFLPALIVSLGFLKPLKAEDCERILLQKKQTKSCQICGHSFAEFKLHGIPPRQGECPTCGGKGRHRAMFDLVSRFLQDRVGVDSSFEILEIGPSRVTTQRLPRLLPEKSRYTAIDIRLLEHHKQLKAPHQYFQMDATQMGFKDEQFDLVMANAVLQGIPNYSGALKEIHRLLKSDGIAMVNIHRSDDLTMTVEAFKEKYPEFSEEYIELNVEAWMFGMDYTQILKNHGFHTLVLNYNAKLTAEEIERYGLKSFAEMFLISKDRQALQRLYELTSDRSEVIE